MADREPIKPATEVQKLRFILGLVIIVVVAFVATRCSELMERNRRIYTPPYTAGEGAGGFSKTRYLAAAQELVRQRLRDPGSAEFTDLKVVPANGSRSTVVCGRVNSRNGFGGMSGPKRFIAGDSVMIEDGVSAVDISQPWAESC